VRAAVEKMWPPVSPTHLVGTLLILLLPAVHGLAFLAVIIGHPPVLYQAFSRREVSISLLDARAGAPRALS
jgi:hypothetical protein